MEAIIESLIDCPNNHDGSCGITSQTCLSPIPEGCLAMKNEVLKIAIEVENIVTAGFDAIDEEIGITTDPETGIKVWPKGTHPIWGSLDRELV